MQAESPAATPDATDHVEQVLAVARSLKACGNVIDRISVFPWGDLKGAVALSEADFRRQFAGLEATEQIGGLYTVLSVLVDGVRVECEFRNRPLAPTKRKVVLE